MKEFYQFLEDQGITPNGHYVLYCMNNSISVKGIPYTSEQYKLSIQGILDLHKDPTYGVYYTLTDKARHILHESEIYICNLKVVKKISKIAFGEWEEKIKEYNDIFPKGRKSGSISFRTNPKELYDKFKWFFAEYPEYNWDMVLEATRRYSKVFEDSCDYTYMQTSKYFIKKDDKNKVTTSTLATICYNIAEGNDEEVSNGTFYFGP
jgi:hypothetical protein